MPETRKTASNPAPPRIKLFESEDLGKRMRAAREQAKLDIEDVASALRLSASAVRQWEAGQKFPSRENLVEFSVITGAEMVWLTTGLSAKELDLLQKLKHSPAPVPVLPPSVFLRIESDPKRWATSWIFPSYPCSERAFAIEVDDHFNAPEYELADLLVIDPAVEPAIGDMVLAAVGPTQARVFARYSVAHDERPRELSPTMLEAAARRLGVSVSELADTLAEGCRPGVSLINLVPLRGESYTVGPGFLEGRIVGVMTEHHRPRRAVSTRRLTSP